MSEWKETTLDHLFDVQNGYSFKSSEMSDEYEENCLEVFKMGHIKKGGGLRKNPKRNYVPFSESLKKFILNKGDLVMAMTDMKDNVVILGIPAKIDKSNHYVLNQRVARLVKKDDDQNDADFLFYQMIWRDFVLDLQSRANSGVQVNLSTSAIKASVFVIPPPSEQQNIASILSSLDDKIHLLHRQNQTLEQMAEILFRQWFVEEADEDWEVVQLQDIAEIKNGFAFSSRSYVDFSPEHLEVLKMGHIEKGGGLRTDPKRDYVPREERLERYILDKGDIVMAMTDMKDNVVILGVPAMIDESDRYVLNQRVARIYLKNRDSLINEYLLYVQLKDPDFIAVLQSKANSGVQVNLSTASIKESEILIPPMELQLEKGNSITDLYLKKEYNDKQIKSLTKLRDTLLPKLMSREIRLIENG